MGSMVLVCVWLAMVSAGRMVGSMSGRFVT